MIAVAPQFPHKLSNQCQFCFLVAHQDEELYQLFCGPSGPQGDVEAIRVVRDPDSSLGKGIAYVLFKTRV